MLHEVGWCDAITSQGAQGACIIIIEPVHETTAFSKVCPVKG